MARGAHSGPENHNWRGGRTITSHGYVLVRLPGHHLADTRGYVYEHRLVAERKLGRRLRPDEEVHHVNKIKDDNRPENIAVMPSRLAHFQHHRRREKGLRVHGEPNPTIFCECGCRTSFPKYDRSGRPRRFVSGHNIGRDIDGRFVAR